jgi:hypothetical protein
VLELAEVDFLVNQKALNYCIIGPVSHQFLSFSSKHSKTFLFVFVKLPDVLSALGTCLQSKSTSNFVLKLTLVPCLVDCSPNAEAVWFSIPKFTRVLLPSYRFSQLANEYLPLVPVALINIIV